MNATQLKQTLINISESAKGRYPGVAYIIEQALRQLENESKLTIWVRDEVSNNDVCIYDTQLLQSVLNNNTDDRFYLVKVNRGAEVLYHEPTASKQVRISYAGINSIVGDFDTVQSYRAATACIKAINLINAEMAAEGEPEPESELRITVIDSWRKQEDMVQVPDNFNFLLDEIYHNPEDTYTLCKIERDGQMLYHEPDESEQLRVTSDGERFTIHIAELPVTSDIRDAALLLDALIQVEDEPKPAPRLIPLGRLREDVERIYHNKSMKEDFGKRINFVERLIFYKGLKKGTDKVLDLLDKYERETEAK